jgi:hypothetical protein
METTLSGSGAAGQAGVAAASVNRGANIKVRFDMACYLRPAKDVVVMRER